VGARSASTRSTSIRNGFAPQDSISAVVDAVTRSNRNVGGNVSKERHLVRDPCLGLIEAPRISSRCDRRGQRVPIFVRQVADVKIGDAFRTAALVKADGGGGGVVVARYGVSTVEVIDRVKEKIAALQAGCRPGRIVPFYDRSALIERAVATSGGHSSKRRWWSRSSISSSCSICDPSDRHDPDPLAVLIASSSCANLGITSNIMSLAGIAIAIGVLVDAAIVVTENAFRFIEKRGVIRVTSALSWHSARRHPLVAAPSSFDGHHRAGLHSGLRLTARRQLFHPSPSPRPSPWRGDHPLCDPRAGAVHASHRRQGAWRGAQPDHATARMDLRPLLGWALATASSRSGWPSCPVGALALTPRIGKEFMPRSMKAT